jgi:hypothetical protein
MSPKVSRSLIWIPLKTDAHSAAMPSNCKVIVPQHGRQVNLENRSTMASASIQCQSSDYPSISTFYWKRFDRSPHLWYDVSVEIAVLPEWRPERSSRSLGGNLQSPTKIGELRLVSRPAGRLVSWIVLAEILIGSRSVLRRLAVERASRRRYLVANCTDPSLWGFESPGARAKPPRWKRQNTL